jgi:glycosyltransferase involved in cell wall biosynthesis
VHPQTSHAIGLAALATVGSRARLVIARRVTFPLRANVGTRWKYRRADAVIAVCRAAVPGLVERGVEPSRVAVIPSGVDLARRIVPASPETLAGFGVPLGAPLVVMVAAIAPMKDPLTFVRAVAAARRDVPALHALLVGEGPMRGAVEALSRELGIVDALHLTGFRPDADAFLAAADVVALSSAAVGEGIAGVLIDAISLGKPVAATRAGGIPEVVEDGVSGVLVPVGDGEALGRAIARLVTDRALAARMGAAGLARAPDFSIETTVARTIEVYERLARAAPD